MIEECIQLQIDQAIDALAEGEVVVFPTETVYGIGVDSTNYEAVDRLFEVKQRPKDNPVTLHVSDVDMVKAVAYVTDDAQTLMADFWPGALAIILEVKENTVSPNVNAGKKTVGFRLPDNDIAKQLIAGLGKPVAGTSANVSGQLSSTSFKQVTEYFQDNVAAFIDGGPSQIGIESTVLDLTTDVPTIIRPGSITKEQIERSIGKSITEKTSDIAQKYAHYTVESDVLYGSAGDILASIDLLKEKNFGVLASESTINQLPAELAEKSLAISDDIQEALSQLYRSIAEMNTHPDINGFVLETRLNDDSAFNNRVISVSQNQALIQ
ncbi:threonylcarbamoyl-AMP synthase [Jeotgalibaca sp. PTS2502]|uniref:L-threonylcarbamoyladenylate synthase n=1 Tax=Jeotgalibaca sp. PTS2502 TaxID=1903686 RepID=UPI000973A940|nr:L-threonylcarbamoyladenylate synthase [Jeotgalibaca sp. PTS2502]APZ49790.1 threonylcarbamoyl-AMP synthase [Jeotgalibaca sp. PTS2502]